MKKLIGSLLLFASFAFGQDAIKPDSNVFDQAIIDTAMKEIGVVKQVGYESTRVREYVETTDQEFAEYYNDGWCNAFVSWVMKQNGYQFASLNTYDEVEFFYKRVAVPKIGDVVILEGHIAIYAGEAPFSGIDNGILLLGGNQAHKVCVFPLAKQNVKFYLEPVKAAPGWMPSRHLSVSGMNSYNLLDDKGYIQEKMEQAEKIGTPSASKYPF